MVMPSAWGIRVARSPEDGPAADAFLDELLGHVHQGVDLKDEGEQDQRQEERRDHFLDDVAVEGSEHESGGVRGGFERPR